MYSLALIIFSIFSCFLVDIGGNAESISVRWLVTYIKHAIWEGGNNSEVFVEKK
jgi:hypothetical protein